MSSGAEVKLTAYGINLDAPPVLLPGFEVVSHQGSGVLDWNPHRPLVGLQLANCLRKGKIAKASRVLEEFWEAKVPLANSNVLDHLINNMYRNPGIVPESWKFDEQYDLRNIVFLGTLYRFEGGLCARYLRWYPADAIWTSQYVWLDSFVNSSYLVAVVQGKKEEAAPPVKHPLGFA
jgi:hypothetical protein